MRIEGAQQRKDECHPPVCKISRVGCKLRIWRGLNAYHGMILRLAVAAIQQALASAGGMQAAQVAVTHVHGIGQTVADVSELLALRGALAPDHLRKDKPLVLLNHKGNFGHTVSASGLLGLVTTVLSLRHGEDPNNMGLI